MDRDEFLHAMDRELRIDYDYPGARREKVGNVVRSIFPIENSGFIGYSSLDPNTMDEEIDAQVAYFRELGYEFEWKVYDHDRPSNLRERLRAHSFAIEEPEALLALDLQHAPDFYWSMPLPPIEQITTRDAVDELMRFEDEIWGTDHTDLGKRLAHDLQETPEQLSVYAVRVDGRIVSGAWIYYHAPTQFASLWGGSTLAPYRGRGYYTGLLAIRAREARKRGYRFLTIDASPMSRPIVEKHGFLFYGYSTPCVWKPAFDGEKDV